MASASAMVCINRQNMNAKWNIRTHKRANSPSLLLFIFHDVELLCIVGDLCSHVLWERVGVVRHEAFSGKVTHSRKNPVGLELSFFRISLRGHRRGSRLCLHSAKVTRTSSFQKTRCAPSGLPFELLLQCCEAAPDLRSAKSWMKNIG